MRTLLCSSLAAATLAVAVDAQTKSLVHTGRFRATSLDRPNDTTTGQTTTRLDRFDVAYNTPGATNDFARSWIPSITHQTFRGDPDNVNDYTSFEGLTPSVFDKFHLAGVFFKDADKASGDVKRAYYTVRDEVMQNFQVFDANGSSTLTIQPGDFFRWDINGNVEFFITEALIAKALGPIPPNQIGNTGASCICQDSMGNLYWSPNSGNAFGSWVTGNNFSTGAIFVNDGGIIALDAANITYDPVTGNVLDVVADTARVVYDEIQHINQMVANAAAMRTDGTTITSLPGMVGLDIDPDPLAGTAIPPIGVGDPPNAVFPPMPHFVFTGDSGRNGGTIFSTQNLGQIALINTVPCGSQSMPADGSWLGVQLDFAAFEPTPMGLAVIDQVVDSPLVFDMPNNGALAVSDPTLIFDFQARPNMGVFVLVSAGPAASGAFQPGQNFGSLPLFAPGSFPCLFILNQPDASFVGTGDANGYASFSAPNPLLAPGTVVQAQSIGLLANQVLVSNPVTIQWK